MSIKQQISIINNEIKDKAELIAVSKTRSIEDINEAYNQGQKKFGENRVQEIVDKFNYIQAERHGQIYISKAKEYDLYMKKKES